MTTEASRIAGHWRLLAANEDLGANPGDVNASPYEKGWLFKLKLKNRAELGELMARDEYAKAAGV